MAFLLSTILDDSSLHPRIGLGRKEKSAFAQKSFRGHQPFFLHCPEVFVSRGRRRQAFSPQSTKCRSCHIPVQLLLIPHESLLWSHFHSRSHSSLMLIAKYNVLHGYWLLRLSHISRTCQQHTHTYSPPKSGKQATYQQVSREVKFLQYRRAIRSAMVNNQ